MSRNNQALEKFYFQIVVVFLTIFLIACLILLFININKNIGVIPLIFITLSILSVLFFLYYLLYIPKSIELKKRVYNIKFSLILFFIINIILSFFSIITLWI